MINYVTDWTIIKSIFEILVNILLNPEDDLCKLKLVGQIPCKNFMKLQDRYGDLNDQLPPNDKHNFMKLENGSKKFIKRK